MVHHDVVTAWRGRGLRARLLNILLATFQAHSTRAGEARVEQRDTDASRTYNTIGRASTWVGRSLGSSRSSLVWCKAVQSMILCFYGGRIGRQLNWGLPHEAGHF